MLVRYTDHPLSNQWAEGDDDDDNTTTSNNGGETKFTFHVESYARSDRDDELIGSDGDQSEWFRVSPKFISGAKPLYNYSSTTLVP